jgi:hypothetical protein
MSMLDGSVAQAGIPCLVPSLSSADQKVRTDESQRLVAHAHSAANAPREHVPAVVPALASTAAASRWLTSTQLQPPVAG